MIRKSTSLFMHRGDKMKFGDGKKVMDVSLFLEGLFIRFFYLYSSNRERTSRFKIQ